MSIKPQFMTVFCVLLLTACAGNEHRPTANFKDTSSQAQRVEPATKVLGQANDVYVHEIHIQKVRGRLMVKCKLFNGNSRPDVINYRVRWLDPDGWTINQYNLWETVSVGGHEQSVLSAMAQTGAATDFRIELEPNQ